VASVVDTRVGSGSKVPALAGQPQLPDLGLIVLLEPRRSTAAVRRLNFTAIGIRQARCGYATRRGRLHEI
jgi:hypothetical protein